ncbi:chemotaxis response regulator protein-glutamate methylesterase [Ramlibacter tataouinensis]|uniref:protein-glutamate methylesterase/protein-glutamine glutaminase n=1 Tax=Ramlibacter tataouinensis TaxID=94132 RepID=UPI0022F3E2A9|nr:chemotaxis response regulator protein-glutamate methylesterase [Ramlibacter tataouinensis]WBY00217.1 chemotaxis response regulator protein-glutamate methylesterase [Ramlibacter tataouinensis]
MGKTGVLIVDDSAVARQALTEILSQDGGLHVQAAVADPLFAMQRMRSHWPDVIVLDIEMPRMDGLTFLRRLMAQRPTPVVVCSSLTGHGAAMTVQALAAGAVSVVAKPRAALRGNLHESAAELVQAVRAAALVNVRNLAAVGSPPVPSPAATEPGAGGRRDGAARVIALGASTGGTQALEAVLKALPAAVPGMVVVQHMPEKFTAAFAERLDALCRLEVREARDGDAVLPGRVLIAPGGRHMSLRRGGSGYGVEVRRGPSVHHHCPSVDVLFRSVAGAAGPGALGIIMTGMGADGALGLLELRRAGARTVAQDEASSVVFGMNREAIRAGAVERVLPLAAIAPEIVRYAEASPAGSR